jgi:hypothetical protein
MLKKKIDFFERTLLDQSTYPAPVNHHIMSLPLVICPISNSLSLLRENWKLLKLTWFLFSAPAPLMKSAPLILTSQQLAELTQSGVLKMSSASAVSTTSLSTPTNRILTAHHQVTIVFIIIVPSLLINEQAIRLLFC